MIKPGYSQWRPVKGKWRWVQTRIQETPFRRKTKPELVAQRSHEVSILGDAQNLAGHSPQKPALSKGWDQISLLNPCNLSHPATAHYQQHIYVQRCQQMPGSHEVLLPLPIPKQLHSTWVARLEEMSLLQVYSPESTPVMQLFINRFRLFLSHIICPLLLLLQSFTRVIRRLFQPFPHFMYQIYSTCIFLFHSLLKCFLLHLYLLAFFRRRKHSSPTLIYFGNLKANLQAFPSS